MSAEQVEFTQNSVGNPTFSQSVLCALAHLVCAVVHGFCKKVLRSKTVCGKSGAVTASAASGSGLNTDLVPASHPQRTHENHTFAPIEAVVLTDSASCFRSPMSQILINERQSDARHQAVANAVSKRERHGAMRGVSHVGHRTESIRGFNFCRFQCNSRWALAGASRTIASSGGNWSNSLRFPGHQ